METIYDKGGISKHWGKLVLFKENILGQLTCDIRLLSSYNIHLKKFQMDEGSKCNSWNHTSTRGKHGWVKGKVF